MSADSATKNRPMNPDANQSLDRTLECAIVVSWPDLTHSAQTGLIHIEYAFASTGTPGLPEGLVIHDTRSVASGL